MNQLGIIYGFQWIDGSFLENVEVSENRSPNDIDVVTFFGKLDMSQQASIRQSFPEFVNPALSKQSFNVDHYPIDYSFKPDVTVEATRYWLQLFSHNRNKVWKGILRISLNTPIDDKHAMDYLNQLQI